MDKDDIKKRTAYKRNLDEISEEWFSADELEEINEECVAPMGDKAMYLRAGKQIEIIEIVAGRVHYRIDGTLSRRRAVMLLFAMIGFISTLLGPIAEFIGVVLRGASGP